MQEITPHGFTALQNSPEMIDVRTPSEFSAIHYSNSRNIPLGDELVTHIQKLYNTESPLYLTCQGGTRAKNAIKLLETAGFTNLTLVTGGINAFQSAGIPLEKGSSGVISLERQVRICAGIMVFVGTLLSAFISPYFLIIPGFVGAGLTFAGITDTCGMGLMLAKMPWNTRTNTNCCTGGSCNV